MGRRERGSRKLRFLDEWVGPVLLFLLRIFYLPFKRWANPRREQIKSIALLKFAGVGDLILLSSILTDLRRSYPSPEVHITLFVGKENASYAQFVKGFDELVCVEITSPKNAFRALRERPFDLVLNFESWSRWAAILSTLMRAGKVIGFSTRGQFRHFGDDVSVPHRGDRHELENFREIVRAAGVRDLQSPPQLIGQPWTRPPVEKPFLIFHLWASGRTAREREWAWARWTTLLAMLPPSFSVLITGGKSDEERAKKFYDSLPPSLQTRAELKIGQSWSEIALLLSHSRGVISGDTGIAHLAAAHGVPTVTLFGPSQPSRWRPIGKRAVPIFKPAEDKRFLSLGFEVHPHLNSMSTILVADVFTELQKLGVFS